jgi:hypothetical protein
MRQAIGMLFGEDGGLSRTIGITRNTSWTERVHAPSSSPGDTNNLILH